MNRQPTTPMKRALLLLVLSLMVSALASAQVPVPIAKLLVQGDTSIVVMYWGPPLPDNKPPGLIVCINNNSPETVAFLVTIQYVDESGAVQTRTMTIEKLGPAWGTSPWSPAVFQFPSFQAFASLTSVKVTALKATTTAEFGGPSL